MLFKYQSSEFSSAFGSVELNVDDEEIEDGFSCRPEHFRNFRPQVSSATKKEKKSFKVLHVLLFSFASILFQTISRLVTHFIHLNCNCVENGWHLFKVCSFFSFSLLIVIFSILLIQVYLEVLSSLI